MKKSNFFITGCARSGTTALARILDSASNAKVTVEEPLVLHVECRALYDGVLEEPRKTFYIAKSSTMDRWNSEGKIYGDKNVNYVPFIPYIDEKVIFLIRDGRDVVRSLMNWNAYFHETFGTDIYAEADGKAPSLGDYCRPRPLPDNPYYRGWFEMSRFEMCCWYWKEWNRLGLELLQKHKKPSQYRIVNMDTLDMNGVKELFDWLGLKGFDEKKVEWLLYRKINSLEQRFDEKDTFPSYENWDVVAKATFWDIAGEVWERVERLWLQGYNQIAKALNSRLGDSDWFNLFMTESNFRIYLWIKRHVSKGASILDAGAGWASLPILLAKHGYADCTMNDNLPKRVKNAKHLAEKFGVEIKYCLEDMLKLDDSIKYDVVASATWQHPHYPYEKVIEKFASLLKPKGYLILTFWNEEASSCLEEAREEFLKHYKYPKDFGKPFPSTTPKKLSDVMEKHGVEFFEVYRQNTPPTPNMVKMQCTTPEHIIIGQKQ